MTNPGDPDWPTFPNGQPIPQTHAGHPCKDCHHNAQNGDGPCWREQHGGHTLVPGPPTKLTREIADRAAALIGPPEPRMVKHVWAHEDIDIWKGTWYEWLNRGQEDLENGDDTVFAYLAYRVAQAEARAHDVFHTLLRDAVIRRTEVKGDNVLPKRLDPVTREEIVGESVETYAVLKYMKSRWPEDWSEKVTMEHEGRVQVDGERAIPDEALRDPETREALEVLSEATDRNGGSDDG